MGQIQVFPSHVPPFKQITGVVAGAVDVGVGVLLVTVVELVETTGTVV